MKNGELIIINIHDRYEIVNDEDGEKMFNKPMCGDIELKFKIEKFDYKTFETLNKWFYLA